MTDIQGDVASWCDEKDAKLVGMKNLLNSITTFQAQIASTQRQLLHKGIVKNQEHVNAMHTELTKLLRESQDENKKKFDQLDLRIQKNSRSLGTMDRKFFPFSLIFSYSS